jgi:hypothetical protein
MLRAENVPRTPESDALVAKVACEFGSEAMQCVVQNALIRNETDEVDISVLGGDDENDDDGADAALVDSQPLDVVVSVVENTSNVPPSAVSRVSVVSAREWGDAPLCAMTVDHQQRESPSWESTTAMSVDFLHVSEQQCSFECGKRLNRAVAAMLVHRCSLCVPVHRA